MKQFCVEKVAMDKRLRTQDGVLRAESLEATTNAHLLAKRIVSDAESEAERIVTRAQEQARRQADKAETDAIERASTLIATLEKANATIAHRAQGLVVDLALNLFDRLVMQTTSRQKIEASLRRILREAPPRLVDAVLHVHPDDAQLIPEVEWTVKPDDSLARGGCRLEAASGEWRADFTAAVGAIRAAFNTAVSQPDDDDEHAGSDAATHDGEK